VAREGREERAQRLGSALVERELAPTASIGRCCGEGGMRAEKEDLVPARGLAEACSHPHLSYPRAVVRDHLLLQ
jgi:hypothetical protein